MYLRLIPATLAILCLSLFAAPAAEPEETYRELAKCSAIPDGAARLSCYDALMPRVRAALAAGPEELSREDQTSLFGWSFGNLFGSSSGSAVTEQQFGAENLPRPEAPPGAVRPIESITATVTDYAMTPRGKFIVFLDNGQVWRQSDSDNETAYFRRTPGDNKIEISTGALGAYNMTLNGANKVYRVRRIK